MSKKELWDEFDLLEVKAHEVSQMISRLKKKVENLSEHNAELEIENQNLRKRLAELTKTKHPFVKNKTELSRSRQNLEKLYQEGFHVCTHFFGSRRDSECMFCQEIIYGEKWDKIDNDSKNK